MNNNRHAKTLRHKNPAGTAATTEALPSFTQHHHQHLTTHPTPTACSQTTNASAPPYSSPMLLIAPGSRLLCLRHQRFYSCKHTAAAAAVLHHQHFTTSAHAAAQRQRSCRQHLTTTSVAAMSSSQSTATAVAAPIVLVHNGTVEPCDAASGKWLTTAPRGARICIRVHVWSCVLEREGGV